MRGQRESPRNRARAEIDGLLHKDFLAAGDEMGTCNYAILYDSRLRYFSVERALPRMWTYIRTERCNLIAISMRIGTLMRTLNVVNH